TASTVPRASPIRSGLHDHVMSGDVHRSDLDRARGRCGATSGPLECGVEGRQVEDHEPTELVLGFGEGTILYTWPALLEADSGRAAGVLDGRPPYVSTGGLHALVVGPRGAHIGVAP